MDIKLGPRIASLRRAKSMTQEQLALSLGVSPPAVSKWETGASCPDISLLCPLARALETNVDTLLQFEETLTEEQIDARLNEIVETARNHGYEAADGMVQSLLHTYPSSIPLKSRAVTLFDLFAMLFPAQPQEIRDGWTKQKKQLLEDVRASGAAACSLRRAKSMTQEQLALSLGVSPPAVSKWETGASCPDISLLCPLARALETNVDTLLQFEETLTEEQIDARLNEIVETARNHGYEAADGMVQSLLHTYPSSIPLKSRAVTLFDLFAMLFPAQPQEIRDGWTKQKKQLLEDVRASGAAACWQAAVSHLASIAISEGELEKAESLLKELPQHTTDSTSIWAMLYLKKGEASQALEVIQKRLYVLTRQVQNFLIQMMNPEMTPDTARTLELCIIYRQLEDLLGVGNGMSPGFFAQAYQRAGQDQQALDSMIQFVDAITGTVQKPNPILFSPAVKIDGEHPAATKEIRELLLESLLDDGYYKQFHDNKRFMDAVDKLRGSIQEEKTAAPNH